MTVAEHNRTIRKQAHLEKNQSTSTSEIQVAEQAFVHVLEQLFKTT